MKKPIRAEDLIPRILRMAAEIRAVAQLRSDMQEIAILHRLIETCGPGAYTAACQSADPARRRAANHIRDLSAYDAAGCGNG